MSKIRKGRPAPWMEGRIPWNFGLTKESDGRIKKIAEMQLGKSRPAEVIRKCLCRRIPSSLEEKFQRIIDIHRLPYKYVGNGSFVIGHCNPDFINTNSEKIAIEVYARYYKEKNHQSIEQWKKDRAEIFKEFGWKVLYFDETEVNEGYVLTTLQNREK